MAQTAKPKTPQHLDADEESRALMSNLEFRDVIDQAKRTPPDELVSSEELHRRRPLTPEEIAEADAQLDQLEREADEAEPKPAHTTAPAR